MSILLKKYNNMLRVYNKYTSCMGFTRERFLSYLFKRIEYYVLLSVLPPFFRPVYNDGIWRAFPCCLHHVLIARQWANILNTICIVGQYSCTVPDSGMGNIIKIIGLCVNT